MYKKIIVTVTLLYLLLITLLSTLNLSDKVETISIANIDKVVHFCFYLGLNTLLILSIIACKGRCNFRWMLSSTIIVITYSIAIEIIQPYVGRGFAIADIVANSCGAFTALIIARNPTINKFITKLVIR